MPEPPRRAKLDEARFVLQRIDAVDPREGEYEDASASLPEPSNAETLATSAYRAHQALGGDEGAIDLLGSAAAALDEGSRYDPELGKLAGIPARGGVCAGGCFAHGPGLSRWGGIRP